MNQLDSTDFASTAAWKPLRLTFDKWSKEELSFKFISARLFPPVNKDDSLKGSILWGRLKIPAIGVSWAWAETSRQVIVLEDQLNIATNVIFVQPWGDVVAPSAVMLRLNQTVHAVDWQCAIAARCRQFRAKMLPPDANR
jgi:hypothetical protein